VVRLGRRLLRIRVLGHLAGGESVIESHFATVLAAMLMMPMWHQDAHETPSQREELLAPVALAVVSATEDRTEQAALVSLGWHESRWARYVLEGRCADGPDGARCDDGRARSPWQVWAVACPSAHELPESHPVVVERAAVCAVRLLRAAKRRCAGRHPAGDWAGAFGGYGSGAACLTPRSAERVPTMRTVLSLMAKE